MIYQSKKFQSKLLLYAGLGILCSGFMWLGNFVDFINILFTGNNIDNTVLYGLLSFVWLGPSVIFLILVYLEMFKPRIKSFLFTLYLILVILYEILLFLYIRNSYNFILPNTPGEDLLDEEIIIGTPINIMIIIFILSAFVFWFFGFLIKAIQSQSVVRKKFLLIASGGLIFTVVAYLDGAIPPSPFLSIIRFSNFIAWSLYYLGIREEPEKHKKEPPKKEIKIEGGLFRISKRPKQITEEEVSLYKEKKICIVCKGKATGFNIFVCPSCDTLYCQKCATALADRENVCWVCDGLIDNSKPFIPYRKEKKELEPKVLKDDKIENK